MSSLYLPPKVCPPRFNKSYPRKRLIGLLAEKQVFPVVWINSPAGSGKTTLVSDFVRSAQRPQCWYRFDQGDGDPGSFFHYLSLACKHSHRLSRIKLPVLTPEYENGLENFSRNFFREFYAYCKPGMILVLDDYHLISGSDELHKIMQIAFSEIPEGMNIIVNSRHVPPSFATALITKQQLVIVDWSQLKFERDEFNEVLKLIINPDNPHPEKAELEQIFQQSSGWITGMILLLESNCHPDVQTEKLELNNSGLVFDYFSTELKNNISDKGLTFLSQVALMPVMSAENAFKLTGNEQAGEILHQLSKEHLFVNRNGTLKISYEFNPLFREYLLEQLKARHSKSKIKSLKAIAGYLLLKTKHVDEAARVFIESESWNKLEEIIASQAKTFIEQGRHITIEFWLKSMPKEFVGRKPWLLFWLGNSILQTKPIEARVFLQQAYEGFLTNKDKKGLYLCWANIIDSFIFGWNTFSPISEWLEKLKYLQAHYPGVPGIETKARVCVSAFTAMLHACPDHVDFPIWLRKMENIFRFVRIDLIRAFVGSQLSFYYMVIGDMARFSSIVFSIAALKRSDKLPPLPRLLTAISEINFYIYTGEMDKADETLNYALQLAKDKGVCLFDSLLLTLKVHLHGTKEELDEAEFHLQKFAANLKEERKLDYAYSLFLSVWLNLMRGNIDVAYYQSCEYEKLIKKLCFAYPIMLADLLHAQVLIKRKEFKEAENHLQASLDGAIKSKTLLIQFMCLSTQACLLLKNSTADESHVRALLEKAFLIGREQNIFFTPIWNREIMKAVFLYAHKHNIEVTYTSKLMKKHGYVNNSVFTAASDLNWEVKIFGFGELVVEIKGEEYKNKSKAKSKPIQLLKVLLASESGSLPQPKICELLWPDTEGDFAHQSLKTTLFRLRKILGSNNVVLSEGCLSLNRTTVWIDCLALNDLVSQVSAPDKMGDLFENMCSLYKGDFLMQDSESWVFPTREKYKLKLIDFSANYASQLMASNKVDRAIEVFEKGLEFDDSSEKLYNGLIECCLQFDRHEQAEKILKQFKHNIVDA